MTEPDGAAASARPSVAVLGAGTMGEAVLAGVLRGGWAAEDVVAVVRRPERAAELEERHGVRCVPLAEGAARDVLVVAVKPQQLDALLADAAAHVRPGSLVVSVAAGVTTARLAAALPDGVAVVRAMPNTPALVGEGVTALSPAPGTDPARVDLARRLLAGAGDVVDVPEASQDAATAVSGSGPAYVLLVLEALVEAGVHAGLPRATASRLATGTLAGTAALVQRTGEHPSLLREKVTSPGGTTAAGLRKLDDAGVRAAVLAAVEAARDRSRALGG
ncbi:pyrroline-5-carboxylate reductase [Pseudokineococcus lusitanus]|uniref:Pyrroline-5-carboxylate reductase n=1 Tax=Pseudokineococcus lusitanus TaxID=763993 RepID=A0A3N1HL98_9ACTN|nr:pyrroline-5-carboxylate reductase [Pseudokineococcus lusitanus]ROP43298.1 pyrroline-5-carboxylate reductase [Pseudokineococcus lusitanus]